MKKVFLRIGLSSLLLITAVAGVTAGDFEIGGYVRNNTGVFIDTLELSQFVNTLDLKFNYYGDMSGMNAEVYLNVTDDIEETEVGVRELYMDLYFNSIDLRIGKQKIIWGKADGVFITDVVSPLDVSEFLTREMEEIRLGVTAFKFDWYMSDLIVELIWIPVFSPAITPDADSPWNIRGMVPVTSEPEINLNNSEGFAKVSYMGSAIDVELMGGYMFDDFAPVDSFTPGAPPTATAQYDRVGLLGGSFSTDISGAIFRGEGAYYLGRNLTVGEGPSISGTVEKNLLHYMFGLDYATNGYMFGTQFIQEIIFDYQDDLVQYNEFTNMMTFMAAKTFLGETLKLEFFTYFGITDLDAMMRFRTYYDITDGVQWILGTDIFVGDESGGFGQYKDNSTVYTKISYSF